MPEHTRRLIKFWQELKRRKVFGVVTTYAATAYIFIEVTNNIVTPLHLPGWVPTLVILLVVAGLPVAVILSWIFDFTPQGIKKTETLEELENREIVSKPAKQKLRLSYVINAFLLVAVAVLAYPRIFKPDTVERLRSSGERISVAVMPFQNLTNDTIWNIWQEGIQQCLISAFSNTGELKVRPQEAINKLLQPGGLPEYAAISPGLAGTISKKLDADIFINGSVKKTGSEISVDAQLIDTKSREVLKSFNSEGPYREDSIRQIIDSLSKKLNDFLIITKLIKENPVDGFSGYPTTTKSPEAFRLNMYGNKAFVKMDFTTARDWYSKALAIDSNYFDPLSNLAYSYGNVGMRDEYIQLVRKIYRKKDHWPLYEQLCATIMYSTEFEPFDVTIRYVRQRQDIDGLPDYYLGLCYNATNQFDKAINEFEKVQEQAHKWGKEFLKEDWAYINLGSLYHKTGQYKKEKKLYREAEKSNDDHESTFFSRIIYRQAILSLSEGDSVAANGFIAKYIPICKQNSASEASIADDLARIYSESGTLDIAEKYYKKALSLEPESPDRMYYLAWFFFENGRKIDEGLELIDKALKIKPDNYLFLDSKGWGLYKQGRNKEALGLIEKSLELFKPYYSFDITQHLEEVKKAIAKQK